MLLAAALQSTGRKIQKTLEGLPAKGTMAYLLHVPSTRPLPFGLVSPLCLPLPPLASDISGGAAAGGGIAS
jgi:hypothetical protein